MDTLSHGLYGGVAFGRKSKRSFILALTFGMLPDLLSFGIFTIVGLLGGIDPEWQLAPPDPATIPDYVYTLYNYTHSFVIATLVIGAVWLYRGKPLVELFAWPLHILFDIPMHSLAFFPTPFLWPLSDYRFDGVSWGSGYIILGYLSLITILLIQLWYSKRTKATPGLLE
jgi:hypothetical protein